MAWCYSSKVEESRNDPFVLPHTRRAIVDAFERASLSGVEQIHAIETHDCFTTSEYMAIDHFGLTPPGKSWQAIEAGVIEIGGKCPINPSGGLIGAGHPVGATGVRILATMSRELQRRGGRYALVTMCIGGGQGLAAIFERVQ